MPATWEEAFDGNRDELARRMDVSTTGLLNKLADLKIIDPRQRGMIEVSISVFFVLTYHFAF